jgi:transcriptional regulator with XRE-family HTH domain
MKKFGSRIDYEIFDALRRARGLSYAALARRVGVTESNIRYIALGKNEPRVGTALLLARELRTTTEKLFPLRSKAA